MLRWILVREYIHCWMQTYRSKYFAHIMRMSYISEHEEKETSCAHSHIRKTSDLKTCKQIITDDNRLVYLLLFSEVISLCRFICWASGIDLIRRLYSIHVLMVLMPIRLFHSIGDKFPCIWLAFWLLSHMHSVFLLENVLINAKYVEALEKSLRITWIDLD